MNPSLSDLSVRVRGFCRNTVPPSTITLEYEHPTLGSNEFATLRYSPTFSVGEALALGSATPDDDERDIVDGINLLMEAAVFAIEGHYLRKSPSADYLGKRHEFWRQVIHAALDELFPQGNGSITVKPDAERVRMQLVVDGAVPGSVHVVDFDPTYQEHAAGYAIANCCASAKKEDREIIREALGDSTERRGCFTMFGRDYNWWYKDDVIRLMETLSADMSR